MTVGDLCDPCLAMAAGMEVTIKPKVIIKKLNDGDAGNDGLFLKGEFVLPAGLSFDDIDPIANGAIVTLSGLPRQTVAEAVVPATVGWTTNKKRTKYQFKDKAGINNGVVKIKLLDRSKKNPGQVKIQVKVKDGTWPVAVGQVPVRVTLSIGDGALGLRTDTDFKAADCAFNGSGKTLKCAIK